MFKFLRGLGKAILGLPWAVFTTAVVGSVAFFASVASIATKYGTRGVTRSKDYKTGNEAVEAFTRGLWGIVTGSWAMTFSGVTEAASAFGEMTADKESMAPSPKDAGFSDGRIKVPEEVVAKGVAAKDNLGKGKATAEKGAKEVAKAMNGSVGKPGAELLEDVGKKGKSTSGKSRSRS